MNTRVGFFRWLGITGLAFLVQAAAPPQNVLSPEVHPDRRVTFRLWAPRAEEAASQRPVAEWALPVAKG
jgi:hypothetical protein